MLEESAVVVPHPNVIGEEIEGEAVLLVPHAGTVIVLNAVGHSIWQLANGKRSVGEIIERICAEYEVELAQAKADVLAFLASLEQRGVISYRP